MKGIFVMAITLLLLSFSQDQTECDEHPVPYWAYGVNSRIEGETITLRKAFREVQKQETDIEPANGFITLRLNISKNGKLCDIDTFQIDENYEDTEFDNGQLITELENIAAGLTEWKRDEDVKTYNLIRFKIKNGKIEEVF